MAVTLNPILRFAAFGDWGHVNKASDHLIRILHEHQYEIDFCILLGDNFYPDGVNGFQDPRWENNVRERFPTGMRLYALLGNHDYHGDPVAQVLYSSVRINTTWKMPFLYYEELFEVAGNHLQILWLDTAILAPSYTLRLLYACGVSQDKIQKYMTLVNGYHQKQIAWLKEKLANSTATRKIVCGHYPVISNGPHETDRELSSLLCPILREHRVDMYLSGHDHNAQVIRRDGTVFVVAGAASGSVVPTTHIKETLFLTGRAGLFQIELTENYLELAYRAEPGNKAFVLRL